MKSYLVILFLILSVSAFAQHENTKAIVELSLDNDMVFSTDRYYTSGIDLRFHSPSLKKSPINKILLPAKNSTLVYYTLSLTHHMYTPERTLIPYIQYTDRPYAAYILISSSKTSFNLNKRIKTTSGIDIGVIGQAAYGEFIQNQLHKKISYAIPSKGWQNQIQNDICFQYNIAFEEGLFTSKWVEINGFVTGMLGIPNTEANVGGYFRAGIFEDYFKGMAVDVSSHWQTWIYFESSVNFVYYNATLQGGLFNKHSVYTLESINNLLLYTKFGFVVQYSRLSIEFAAEVLSPEFHNAYWHRWGHLDISFLF